MSSIGSWFKSQLEYLKDSLSEILEGIILVVFISSGVLVAFLLRFLEFNGVFIMLIGIITEVITIIVCFFYFKKYLGSEGKAPEIKTKGKKI